MEKNISKYLIALIFAFGLLSSCTNIETEKTSDKITVVTTIFPLYEFAKEVGGNKADVTLLLPPGTEAHTYDPKPSDINKIEKADVFVYIGAGMEPWAHDIIEGTSNLKLTLLDASSKVTLLKSDLHGEHSHEHEGEEHAFEWAGVFDLKAGEYKWSFAKVDGKYADPAMKMAIIKSTEIESVESEAIELFESETDSAKEHNGILTPKGIAYKLNFDENKEVTVFTVKIEQEGKYAFFTEHMPFEFEAGEHFFKDNSGNNMVPIIEEPESVHDHAHEHGTAEEGHQHGEYDPHFWLDFSNDIKVVDAIAETFSQKDPANKEYYLANAQSYKQKLLALDTKYKQELKTCKQKEFITGGHNAYAYLAKSYGIEYRSAFGISPDSEPTPKAIKEIADLTKEHGIKYILFEELVSPRMAEAIAEQTGAKTMVLNPGHNLLKGEFVQGVTFISLMENNLKTLAEAMECG
ncbi:MAG: zinc ABC transporter substrate-binding protein [archaeon]